MRQTRHKFDAKFKAKVAIESIKEHEALNELAAKHLSVLGQTSYIKKYILKGLNIDHRN